jgi:hypothetical protein
MSGGPIAMLAEAQITVFATIGACGLWFIQLMLAVSNLHYGIQMEHDLDVFLTEVAFTVLVAASSVFWTREKPVSR